MTKKSSHVFSVQIEDNIIKSILDFKTKSNVTRFYKPLTNVQYKVYILVDNKKILYIGTTKTSIKNRLRFGLKANGTNGYHGYKWKNIKKTIKLFVWCFENLNKVQIENIEAELAFIVRETTGKWPLYQNEIHFNNSFTKKGNKIAKELLQEIEATLGG